MRTRKLMDMRVFIVLFLVFSVMAKAELPVQSREIQKVWISDGYQIGIDNDPRWSWEYVGDPGKGELVVLSPENYYPPAVVAIKRIPSVQMGSGEHTFRRVAFAALRSAAVNYGGVGPEHMSQLSEEAYQQLKGYAFTFNGLVEKENREVKIALVRNTKNQIFSLTAVSPEEKIAHLTPALNRMWNNISFIENKFDASVIKE